MQRTGKSRTNAVCRFVALLLLTATAAGAQNPKVSVSGSPATLSISNAIAGSAPINVVDNSTSYGISGHTTHSTMITAQLSSNMPAGTSLTINLAAPTGGSSLGTIALDTTPRTVVTGIPSTSKQTGLTIAYQLSATIAAGVLALASRTVTLTIVDLP
jgi:hypothetical protein